MTRAIRFEHHKRRGRYPLGIRRMINAAHTGEPLL
jgi:hypothetical protein